MGRSRTAPDRPRLPFVLALVAALVAVAGVAIHRGAIDDPETVPPPASPSPSPSAETPSVEVVVGMPRLISTGAERAVFTGVGEGASAEGEDTLRLAESVIPISVRPNGEVRPPARGGRTGAGRHARAGEPLPADQILSTVSSNTASVRRCHEREMRRTGGPIEARILVRMRIEASGAVGAVSVQGDSTSPRLERCIEDAARAWVFAESSGTTEIETPFSLTARQ